MNNFESIISSYKSANQLIDGNLMAQAEDTLVSHLLHYKNFPHIQEKIANSFLCQYELFSTLASEEYHETIQNNDRFRLDNKIYFHKLFLNSWQRFFLSSVFSESLTIKTVSESVTMRNNVLLCWHFSVYPAIIKFLIKHNFIVLVARHAPWMEPLARNNLLLVFRNASSVIIKQLFNAFKIGRPIFAMMDYCYDETRYTSSRFLGKIVRTPSGIIELAIRYNYEFSFTHYHDYTMHIKKIAMPSVVDQCVTVLNKLIEANILSAPEEWLLWGSLQNRLIR